MIFREFATGLDSVSTGATIEEKTERLAQLLQKSEGDILAAVNLCAKPLGSRFDPIKANVLSFNQIYSTLSNKGDSNGELQLILDTLSVTDVYLYLKKVSQSLIQWLSRSKPEPPELPIVVDEMSRKWFTVILYGGVIKDNIMLEAISRLHSSAGDKKSIRQISLIYKQILPDYGIIAQAILKGGMKAVKRLSPKPGFPFKPETLGDPPDVIDENKLTTVWLTLGGGQVFIQPKYRGEQLLIHFTENGVSLFDRRLVDVTNIFSDVAEICRDWMPTNQAILDAEVVGYEPSTDRYSADYLTRTVKHHIAYIFDLIHLDGVDWYKKPFYKRREQLTMLLSSNKGAKIQLAHEDLVDSLDEVQRLYNYWVHDMDFEGVILKRKDGTYRPAKKSRDKVRVKEYFTVDAIVVGYNQKSQWQVSFLVALWNQNRTGLTEVRFTESVRGGKEMVKKLLEHFKLRRVDKKPDLVFPDIIPQFWVTTDTVVEIQFEGYKQPSKKYKVGGVTIPGGTVLNRLRPEKDIYDADVIDKVKNLPYAPQKL
jgi:ATP-dependent DNA ligase